jgi:P27 family predicted phage terminase small subunit
MQHLVGGGSVVGARGPGKTPTNLALVRGQRQDRINSNSPEPSAIEVKSPTWLTPPARTVWKQYAPDLEKKGVLTAWDVEEFACWCDAAARRRRAVRKLAAEGEIVQLPVFNKNGELTGHRIGKNPWLLVLTDADIQLRAYGTRFGMTPSDRASLAIGEGAGDADDDLLTG